MKKKKEKKENTLVKVTPITRVRIDDIRNKLLKQGIRQTIGGILDILVKEEHEKMFEK